LIPGVLDPVSGDLLLPSWLNNQIFQLTTFTPFLNSFNATGIPTDVNPTVQAVDPMRHIDYIAHWGEPHTSRRSI